MPLISFCTLWKHQKTRGILGGVERDHGIKWVKVCTGPTKGYERDIKKDMKSLKCTFKDRLKIKTFC